ncbi:hypothetical protein [Virgibacillus salexigens]|uniref:Uncharacterized protein n=1 Tax=Virgibacillus massiliensis TaxID=1462526 RepID=A0A024QH07_9BACI|nr:hypothetical protein [Virgibacillus massiliensis]CDQ41492.1 hypothetical protein BN990_03865 [Virgibacillus massiliensis]
MVLAFQIIGLIIILFSWIIACYETDKKRQENMAFITAIAMALIFSSLVWL